MKTNSFIIVIFILFFPLYSARRVLIKTIKLRFVGRLEIIKVKSAAKTNGVKTLQRNRKSLPKKRSFPNIVCKL
jgi:hypothetical protein